MKALRSWPALSKTSFPSFPRSPFLSLFPSHANIFMDTNWHCFCCSTGKGTVYYQENTAGSCGKVNGEDSKIVALSKTYMKSFNSPNCGKNIKVKNTSNGKTLTLPVADTCDGCGANDVDFSLGAWNVLTDNAAPGTFPVSW